VLEPSKHILRCEIADHRDQRVPEFVPHHTVPRNANPSPRPPGYSPPPSPLGISRGEIRQIAPPVSRHAETPSRLARRGIPNDPVPVFHPLLPEKLEPGQTHDHRTPCPHLLPQNRKARPFPLRQRSLPHHGNVSPSPEHHLHPVQPRREKGIEK